MADVKKLSELTEASNVAATDLIEISQDQGAFSYLSKKVTWNNATSKYNTGEISFWIDGQENVITTGDKAWIKVPYNGIITGWYISADAIGSVVCTVKKSISFPTFNDISGSEKPTLISQISNQDTNLSTWTTSFNNGDYFQISIDSVAIIKKLLVSLYTTKI